MKIVSATFVIDDVDNSGVTWRVIFVADKVKLQKGTDELFVVANEKRTYKPCATHAIDLIRAYQRSEPRSTFAKQRAAKMKPRLKLVTED